MENIHININNRVSGASRKSKMDPISTKYTPRDENFSVLDLGKWMDERGVGDTSMIGNRIIMVNALKLLGANANKNVKEIVKILSLKGWDVQDDENGFDDMFIIMRNLPVMSQVHTLDLSDNMNISVKSLNILFQNTGRVLPNLHTIDLSRSTQDPSNLELEDQRRLEKKLADALIMTLINDKQSLEKSSIKRIILADSVLVQSPGITTIDGNLIDIAEEYDNKYYKV